MMKKFLSVYSIIDLVVLAILAALGIAVGSIIGVLVRLITGPLMIPGGAVAGGVYMLFLVLAVSFTGKKSAALLCGFVQAIIVMVTGFGGHHGIATIITYTMPGLCVFILLLLIRHKCQCILCCFLSGMTANITGTFLVAGLVMAIPTIPMLLSLATAALFGGLGGILAYNLTKQIKKSGIIVSPGDQNSG